MERADSELPKPMLVQLFERIAEIMELDEGQTGLELYFENGRLRRWTARDLNKSHDSLRRFDDRARQIL
jgi:hypothetical protein